MLAEEFIKGAAEKGGDVFKFDAAFKKVHPCIGCLKCNRGDNECVFKDDMLELYPELLAADVVVFATPLNYHTYTAQLKAAIDRFHAKDKFLCGANKQAVLLATGANPNAWVMNGINACFETSLRYLGWKDAGRVLAIGCAKREDIELTGFPKKAYELGYTLN